MGFLIPCYRFGGVRVSADLTTNTVMTRIAISEDEWASVRIQAIQNGTDTKTLIAQFVRDGLDRLTGGKTK